MKHTHRFLSVVLLGLAITSAGITFAAEGAPELPPEWRPAWNDPPADCRPLQIVHALPPSQANPEAMKKLKDLGLGGIVCNVSFDGYLRHGAHWRTLIDAVRACRETGLIVWIYDEHGYPSGAAGGRVLENHPQLEALALAHDPAGPKPFAIRPSYEHTHASNNFHAARRYPNLLDEGATKRFIELTHAAYLNRLQPWFGKTIRAFFTDEPSLMAVNIGPLPDNVRKNVPVADPLDPNLKPLASVPWVSDLPDLYKSRFGEDLTAVRKSLFEGAAEADRRVRRSFWSLVSDLLAERYYGRIQQWCAARRVASSGHILWEEMPLHGVPLEGNPLQMLMRMDIPGLDMLTSNPEAVIHTGWLTATLPASAAIFNGGRKVMTEVSDFSEQMAGKGHVSLDEMRAAAAWQAALGVTEFTLYYNRAAREPQDYRAYCDYVGRLNAVLRDAALQTNVLLYYPVWDLWAEYAPVAEKLTLASQSDRMKKIVESFMSLGRQMTRRRISFALADHNLLADAQIRHGLLWVRGRAFDALVLPAAVELPERVTKMAQQFRSHGRTVIQPDSKPPDFDAISPAAGTLSPPDDRVIIGRFTREGREILLVVNVGAKSYNGKITIENPASLFIADPATGRIAKAKADDTGPIALSLPPRASLLLIGPQ
ncbi:MAG: hypothetical protein JSU94_20745 [Phycisphaerales bacterium]|nr:MAG: hypothetical protein JSU94_20745 [Phycisphaerales bacterium]